MNDAAARPPLSVLPGRRALLRAFFDRYARRYAVVYSLGIACLFATNYLMVTVPALVKEVFDHLSTRQDVERIDTLALLIALCAVTIIVVRTLSRVLFFNPGRTIEFRLRNDILDRLLAMSGDWFRRVAIGDLVSRATNDTAFVRALVGFAVLQLLNLVIAASMALFRMFQTDAVMTLLCFIPMGLAFAILRKGTVRLFGAMKDSQVELGALSDHVLETYKGIAAIATAHAEPAFIDRFAHHNRRYTEINLAVTALRCFILPLGSQAGGLAIFVLLWYGGEQVASGALTIGDLAAYASYIGVLVGSLVMAGWLIASLQRGYVSLERVWEIIGLAPQRGHGSQTLPTGGAGLALSLRGVTLRYSDAKPDDPPALDDIHLDVAPGSVVGVFGPVGSGKSTLVALLSGELSATTGTLEVDGVPIGEIRSDALAAAVAVVPQTSFLFSRSLRENVGFVDPPADVNDAKVAQALALAQLTGELDRLPKGINTVVGERGQMLSGGQRQRAQLARAFYSGFRLLLLDDVLSAVDHDTEGRLLDAIGTQLSGKQAAELGDDHGLQAASAGRPTAVIVSSRLSALMGADEIIVIDHGRIVDRGRHHALAARPGPYQDACRAQDDAEDGTKLGNANSAGVGAPVPTGAAATS